MEKIESEHLQSAHFNKVATFLKDQLDGDLTSTCLDRMKSLSSSNQIIDYKQFYDQANLTKTAGELGNLKSAAAFTAWSFSRLVTEVEDIIENDTSVRHNTIQKKIESALDNEVVLRDFTVKYASRQGVSLDMQFLDYPLPVLIQSGGEFNLNKF